MDGAQHILKGRPVSKGEQVPFHAQPDTDLVLVFYLQRLDLLNVGGLLFSVMA